MAITTYAELQTAVANWLDRSDLTARIPEFIELAEARIRRKQDWYVVQHSDQAGSTLAFTVQGQNLGVSVREVLSAWLDESTKYLPLTVLTPEEWREFVSSNGDATGTPRFVTIIPNMNRWGYPTASSTPEGAQVFLWPKPAGTVQMDFIYISDVAPLSTGVNGILRRHPDVYLYGTLAESAPFLQHDERLPMWETRFEKALHEMRIEAERTRFAASHKRVRLSRVF